MNYVRNNHYRQFSRLTWSWPAMSNSLWSLTSIRGREYHDFVMGGRDFKLQGGNIETMRKTKFLSFPDRPGGFL